MSIALLIPLLPLLAAIVIGALGKRLGTHASRVGIAATVSACFLSIFTLFSVSAGDPIHITLWPFEDNGSNFLKFGIWVDRLTAVMMVLITSVSTVIHVYSVRYLYGDPGYARFFALLGLMTFVILSLVSSPNLLMLFVFWQLLSWTLYLILAFNYTHAPAYQNAFKTLMVHRVGDVAFLCGIIVAYKYFGTLEFGELFERASQQAHIISLLPGNLFDVNVVTVMTLLIFVGAVAKSSQFPLHVWLPDTMDSPTPVSALMHAGIINAGGFLLNRLAPLYALSPNTLHIVFVVGMMTVLFGASMMLVQSDIKKTLGYSTMGQMGYMIMECGLGAFALAIFHLIAHGLFKASLFLSAGNVIHNARHEPKFPASSSHEPTRLPAQTTWVTGLVVTLIMPLIILMVAHDLLEVPLEDAHGAVIFLFFSWVTASQAIFSLYRLHAVDSWKVASAMIVALFLIGFTYLWAGEAFTHFLYPEPGVADGFFVAAALNPTVFDVLILASTVLILLGWIYGYTDAKGQKILNVEWSQTIQQKMYLFLINRLYVDLLYMRWGNALFQWAQRIGARF
ncbi:MAG: NADH-quinone oxidoreductase subunit L [Nitrospirales bacterium]|nr:NADH-quinone oxidoreductase subunit L [Nitrospira sp.]MDR4500654.1 NADH-quinone oxidoreductase subunit L [Nitrospirales bacterium]